ncbi:MAG: hypothetical protein KA123_01995 [Candidatus Eisenbacteria bacterium]|nr:hypothetical protein [Candidatus Eisenbacteria bacterium]
MVLVAGQASNEQSECWSALAGELASLGFEVLMPYFFGASPGSLSETGPVGADELPAWNRAALQEGLEEWLNRSPRPWAVVCEGEAGLALPGILRKPNRVRLAVWISPPGELEAGDCLPDGGQSLLVICSAAQSSGVRAAQDLFRGWGSGADLFVYEHSPTGDCGLAGLKPARQALVGWIAEHGEKGPEAWPSMAESEGCRTEPSRIHLR